MMKLWHEQALMLRQEHLSIREIAARLSKSEGAVQYALDPEGRKAAIDRYWKRKRNPEARKQYHRDYYERRKAR